ncbi:hypothetical protein M433DRAFT_410120 [Acidomyces richmondensis BFW]|nr:hypothetical protein M433DRAFT_410120 [Acidomyces richmondensis BFW]
MNSRTIRNDEHARDMEKSEGTPDLTHLSGSTPLRTNADLPCIVALQTQNAARSSKAVPPLQRDDSLARQAEAHAQQLAFRKKLQHADVPGQGENLYTCTGNAILEQAVQS